MDLLQAILLGLLQGITEWLPISSQGQTMFAAMKLLGTSAEEALKYAVMLHIGTLLAAIIFFRREIVKIFQKKDLKMLKFLGIAFIATAITAVPSYFFLKQLSEVPFYLLLIIGLALIVTGIIQLRKEITARAGLSNKNALFLGLGQGFSALPGISRSGVTTSVLLFEGFTAKDAFRLSFLLSIPSVLAAEIVFAAFEGLVFDFNAVIGLIVAMVVGLASIKLLLKIAEKINFGIFCILFGFLYLIISFI